MHKGLIWALGAVVVVAGGAYVAFGMGGHASMQQGAATSTSTPSMSLRELAASQAPQQCDFTSASDSRGTVFVAGGRVRGDFSAQMAGKAIMGHLIVTDDTAYVWMDGMAQGFKNSFEATTSASQSSQGMNPDERVSYSCKPWSPDESVFALPATITFMTATDMQAKAGAAAMGAQCGQCAQIPDATAKAQCLAALHC